MSMICNITIRNTKHNLFIIYTEHAEKVTRCCNRSQGEGAQQIINIIILAIDKSDN